MPSYVYVFQSNKKVYQNNLYMLKNIFWFFIDFHNKLFTIVAKFFANIRMRVQMLPNCVN